MGAYPSKQFDGQKHNCSNHTVQLVSAVGVIENFCQQSGPVGGLRFYLRHFSANFSLVKRPKRRYIFLLGVPARPCYINETC